MSWLWRGDLELSGGLFYKNRKRVAAVSVTRLLIGTSYLPPVPLRPAAPRAEFLEEHLQWSVVLVLFDCLWTEHNPFNLWCWLGRHTGYLVQFLRSPVCLTPKVGRIRRVCPTVAPVSRSNMSKSYSISDRLAIGRLADVAVGCRSRRGR